ncbi:MAG TPA: hypothetical protein VJJ53_00590 [Candidatus Nanoarchaeia archaeon]|nr:hypothetical protein [Candidatus Nanoarchaeia archaeon]
MIIEKLRITPVLIIFETLTLIVLDFVKSFNIILSALLVGIIGTLAAIIVHNLLSNSFTLMSINKEKIKLNYSLSIFITIFLMVLFLAQNLILYFIYLPNNMLGNFSLGFLSAFLASMLYLSIYNIQPFKIKLIGSNDITIKKTNILNTSLLIAIYEAFILSIMIPLMQISFALAGFTSALIAGLIVTALYNKVNLKVIWK